jgi:hypothetical protein
LIDSKRFRRLVKSGIGSHLFRSNAYRELLRKKRHLTSYYASRAQGQLFADLQTFSIFVGHAKSGGTMIGALLDAHPNVILADEIDVFEYMDDGFSKEQIYHLLLKNSRREFLKGRVTARRLVPYSFSVPGQWQGRYSRLQVIGVSRAGPMTGQLGANASLLDRLGAMMPAVKVKIVHVIRNPFDPISLMMIRGQRSHDNAIEYYFDYCDTLVQLRKQLDSSDMIPVRYESFVRKPEMKLAEICRFLDLEVVDSYLKDCAAIINLEPERSRQLTNWDPALIGIVEKRLAQYDFLQGYSFDN